MFWDTDDCRAKSDWNNCRNPFVEDTFGLPERTNDAAGAYAKACVSVAEEYKIPVINLWNRMQKFPDWEKLMLRYVHELRFPKVCYVVINIQKVHHKSYFRFSGCIRGLATQCLYTNLIKFITLHIPGISL